MSDARPVLHRKSVPPTYVRRSWAAALHRVSWPTAPAPPAYADWHHAALSHFDVLGGPSLSPAPPSRRRAARVRPVGPPTGAGGTGIIFGEDGGILGSGGSGSGSVACDAAMACPKIRFASRRKRAGSASPRAVLAPPATTARMTRFAVAEAVASTAHPAGCAYLSAIRSPSTRLAREMSRSASSRRACNANGKARARQIHFPRTSACYFAPHRRSPERLWCRRRNHHCELGQRIRRNRRRRKGRRDPHLEWSNLCARRNDRRRAPRPRRGHAGHRRSRRRRQDGDRHPNQWLRHQQQDRRLQVERQKIRRHVDEPRPAHGSSM